MRGRFRFRIDGSHDRERFSIYPGPDRHDARVFPRTGGRHGQCLPDRHATSYYCPSAAQSLAVTLVGAGSVGSAPISFPVDNADIDFANYKFAALPGLAGVESSSASAVIWGMPFFYGRSVFLLFSGQSTAGIQGPAIGF